MQVNQPIAIQWHNCRVKWQDLALVLQGVELPCPFVMPVAANVHPTVAPYPTDIQYVYHQLQSTAGQAKKRLDTAQFASTTPAT